MGAYHMKVFAVDAETPTKSVPKVTKNTNKMNLLRMIYNVFKDNHKISDMDLRTKDLPLSSNFTLLFGIVVVYLIFVLKLGPAFMAKRRPYNITAFMQIYNLFQILFNLYLFFGSLLCLRHPHYSWFCMNIDKNDIGPETMMIRKFGYLYFVNKLVDLLDTVFFILRKNFKQVSFLHVYHHIVMVYAGTVHLSFLFATQFSIIGLVNSGVHVLMYVYYFVAARTKNRESLAAWKPRMTQLQIFQFFYIAVKLICSLVNNSCGLPYFWLWLASVQNVVICGLFTHFYWKTYIVKDKKLKSI